MAMLFLMTNYISVSLNTTHLLAIWSNYPFHFISIQWSNNNAKVQIQVAEEKPSCT